MSQNYTHSSQIVNSFLKSFFAFQKKQFAALIRLAYSLGAEQQHVADALKVDKSYISRNFSKKKLTEEKA